MSKQLALGKDFARGAIRARVADRLGYKVIRIEGPVNTINGRKGIELSPQTIRAMAEWYEQTMISSEQAK